VHATGLTEHLICWTEHPARQEDSLTQSLLRRFLDAYWLRPENAFWMTLRSHALSQCPPQHPSIDLGCGDGVFSFLSAGGVFDPGFDVFKAVGMLDKVRDEHADMFDCADESYMPHITSRPADDIDVGADLKPALLNKARKLGFYKQLVEHDSNIALPFESDSFRWVYCNCAYWIESVDSFLREMGRITRADGHIVVQVKLDSMRRYTLERHRSVLGDRFLDIIGRGRIETWPCVADRKTWEDRFARAGLSIESATPFVTRTHAHIWDIGLRPIAPLLVRMTNALTPKTRASIKQEWVSLFIELLEPFCHPDIDLLPGSDEPAEIQYVLTPPQKDG